MAIRRSKAEVAKVLREFKASGLSRAKFAQQSGISKHTLSSWLAKAHWQRTSTKASSIVELNPAPIPAPDSESVKLEYCGISIEVPVHIAPQHLAKLFEAVVKPC